MAFLLLIQSDTSDGSNVFIDSSLVGRQLTIYGDVHHETDEAKFGATSIKFDGSGDYITAPSATDLNLGTGDFTIDFWLYVSAITDYDMIIGRLDSWGNSGQLFVRMHPGVSGVEAQIGGDYLQISSLPLNTWNHISLVRASGEAKLRLDGVTTHTVSSATASITATAPLYIGINPVNSAEAFDGYIDELRVTNQAEWLTDFTPPTAPYALEDREAIVQVPSPLGQANPLLQHWVAQVAAPSPLGAATPLAFHDFTGVLGDATTYYVMDLIGPSGTTRVPISSWQATLQAGLSNYVQCVVPAVQAYASAINAATQFVVSRLVSVPGLGDLTYEMASAPVQTATFDQGPSRYTCTLSGYSTGFAPDEDPSAAYNRTLQDIRSISVNQGGVRVRCSIDWLLRPSMRVTAGVRTFIVSYINYYVGNNDAYMDVGERA